MESIVAGFSEIGNVLTGVTSPSKPLLTLTPDRRNIWKDIVNRMAEEKLPVPCNSEKAKLKRLSTGMRWKDMVDPDWRDIYGALYDESSSFTVPESEVMKIEKDIHRTFGLFTRNIANIKITSKLEKSLQSVLVAASHECGYCQGINFLAALFLIGERDERDAFILLRYLLRHRHLENLFNAKCSSLLEYMNVFSKRFRKNNKAVYTHLKTVGFGPVCYAIEWFTTCFITTCPGDLSACLLDLLLLGFDDIMLRVSSHYPVNNTHILSRTLLSTFFLSFCPNPNTNTPSHIPSNTPYPHI